MLMIKTKLIKKNIGRLLKWFSVATLSLLISTLVALQLPYVQNSLLGMLLKHLSDTTQFAITHQRFQFKWLYRASLTGLTIKDPQDNTMLAVDQLALKINPLQLLMDLSMTLKNVHVKGAQIHLCKEGQEGYNMQIFLHRLMEAIQWAPDTQQASPWVIESASLQDIAFSLDDRQAEPLQDVLDTKHFTIHQINAELANLKIQARSLAVDIGHFSGRHADRPLLVDHFSTFLVVAPGSIQCQALQLRTDCSILEGSGTFTYDPLLPLTAFKDHVHITADLNHVVVAAEELAILSPYFRQHRAYYTFSGAIDGRFDDLRIKDLKFSFGEQDSHLEGCLSLRGLPHVKEVIFNMELQQGALHTQDLLPYLDKKHYELIENFHCVKTKGHFYGTWANFIARAVFDTALGQITTDLEVQMDPAVQRTMYKGAIATSNFELGTWLNNPAVQQLTMQGQIDGEGLSWETAHFQLEANVDKLGLYNYFYERIYARGHFAQAFFRGKLTVDDPHLSLRADAAINLNRNVESIAVKGVVDKACLQALRLTDRRATLRTQLSMTMQGLAWDDMKADAQLNQFCFDLEGKEIRLDALHIHTDQGDFGRLLEVDSTLLALKAEGDFSYASLTNDLNRFIQGYQRHLMHVEPPSSKYVLQPYTLTYHLYCKDINPLLCVLGIDAYVSPHTQLEGCFSQQEEVSFSLRLAEATALAFKQNRWSNTQLELSAHQSKDGQAVSVVFQLGSKEQQWGRLTTTEDLALAISWKNDLIEFSSSLGLQGVGLPIHLQGQAALLDSAIEIALAPTHGAWADHQWQVHPENRITLSKSRMQFQNFEFYKGQQQVSLVGILAADPAEVLYLKIKDYSLENLNLVVNKQLTGMLSAEAVLQGTLGQANIDSDVTLEKLTIDEFGVGDIQAQTRWNHTLQRLNLACQVDYLQQPIVEIEGFYEPFQEVNSLQLTAHVSHAPLAVLEPFVANHLSQLAGEFHGTVYIHGSPASPRLAGGASIQDAAVRINYLNTLYQVGGVLTFADHAIHISTLHLYDQQQGKAVLNGVISHKDFEDFQIDAKGDIDNLTLLSTALEDNEYFYGTGILSGRLSASGPLNNMTVFIKAKTNAGTHIFIPRRGVENTATQYDFIRFVHLKSPYQEKQTQQVTLQGFKLTLLLEITPDAQAELILDAKAGDAIKGRGNGNIKLEVDLEGVLTMAGEIKFLTGEYNLSLYRIINRTFKILPESKITWYDSPSQGTLDIKAVYEQRASLVSLMESDDRAERGSSRYPVQVLVGLQGALLSPKKKFSINFPESTGEFAHVVQEFKSQERQNKKYAETQALSLLLFQEFAGKKNTHARRNAVSRNFSTLASQQLSSLTSRLDDNLDVGLDLDLPELERQDLNTLHLNLSYRLTDRLKVSRKGSLLGTKAYASSTDLLIGDWTVEYILTQDRRLRAKLYSKYMTSAMRTDTEGTAILAGGVSLLYTRGFNQWRELVGGRKQASKKEDKQN
jgi:hypothetical protein